MKKLYLASASPRRRELLDMLGFSYELLLPNANEDSSESDPARLVALLARRKAEAALELLGAEERKNAVIIGCGDYAEIWSEEEYSRTVNEENFADIRAALESFGL